uniref:Uncharacterized protein n=1 Tax=viral metagenome TaxID=1070528 RepID=A0A6M3IK15_9ZZZZ
MKNIDMKVEKNILTIKIDLSKTSGKSKSGKSTVIASTEGNQQFPFEGEIVSIGVNVYKK